MALMPHLQPLLRKHQALPAVAAPLASLLRCLALELYPLKQEEEQLGQVGWWRGRRGCFINGLPVCSI
jgi:hypothetical protein